MLAAMPPLARALWGVKAALDTAWLSQTATGNKKGGTSSPLLKNIVSHYASFVDALSSAPLARVEEDLFDDEPMAPPGLLSILSDLSGGMSYADSVSVRVQAAWQSMTVEATPLTWAYACVSSNTLQHASSAGKKREAASSDPRERVRSALRETFHKGLMRLGEDKPSPTRCTLLAWELELELHRLIGTQDTAEKKEAFRKKYMSLKFNLDDPKNPQVRIHHRA